MPSEWLLSLLNQNVLVEHHWRVNGTQYARTLRAWLNAIDQRSDQAVAVLAQHHGEEQARVQLGRWRIFFMACEELFGFKGGEEWYVAHYLLRKR